MNSNLEVAKAELDRFLDAYPHMRDYQKEIESAMNEATTSEGRMQVLKMMAEGKIIELSAKLNRLVALKEQNGG